MKRNLWKWLTLTILCFSLLACAKGGESNTEAKKESAVASTEAEESAVESSEKA